MAARVITADDEYRNLARLLQAFLVWMGKQEVVTARWYKAIEYRAILGVAQCEEVHRYNQQATLVYAWQRQIVTKLRRGGLTIPDPAFPPLFAEFVHTNPQGDIVKYDFTCLAGFTDPTTLRTNPPRNCAVPPDLGLGAVPGVAVLAACAAAPWSCAIIGLLGLGTTAVIGHYGAKWLETGRRFSGQFTGAERDEMAAAIQSKTAETDMVRVETANKCFDDRRLALGAGATSEQLKALMLECEAYASKLIPDRGAGPQLSSPWAFWIGATVLVGAVGAVIYLARRPGATAPRQIEGPMGAPAGVRAIADKLEEVGYGNVADDIRNGDYKHPSWRADVRKDIEASKAEGEGMDDPEAKAEWLQNARAAERLVAELA